MSGEQSGAGTAILAEIRALHAKVDALMAHLGMHGNAAARGNGPAPSGDVADLADIQGQYGDVKIRMNPKRWTGEPMKGCTASQCPPDFLDVFAEQLEYFAGRQEDPKKADYDRRDARRCRRWAIEIRGGRVKQGATADKGYPTAWDDGAPPARPTPHSAGNAPAGDPWEESNDGSGW